MTKEPLVLKFGYGKLRVQMCSIPAGHEPSYTSPTPVGVAIFTERDADNPACVLAFADMHQACLVTEALAGMVRIPRSNLRQLLDVSGPISFQPADVSLGVLRNGLSVLIPQPVDVVEGAQDTIRALSTDIATFKEALEKSNIVADGLQTQLHDAVSAYDEMRDDVAEMARQMSNHEWTGGIFENATASSLASEISSLVGKYNDLKSRQEEWVCKDCCIIQPLLGPRILDTRCRTPGCRGILKPTSNAERRLEDKVESLEKHIAALPAEWRQASVPIYQRPLVWKEIMAKENLEEGDMVTTDGHKAKRLADIKTQPEDVKAMPLEGTLNTTLPPAEHSNSGVTRLYKCCKRGHTKWMRENGVMDLKRPEHGCPGAMELGSRRPKHWGKVHDEYSRKDSVQQWFGAKLGEAHDEDDMPKCAESKVQQRDRYKVLTTQINGHEYSFNIDYVPQEQHAWLEGTLSSVFSRVVDDARNDTLRSLRKKLGVLKDLLK